MKILLRFIKKGVLVLIFIIDIKDNYEGVWLHSPLVVQRRIKLFKIRGIMPSLTVSINLTRNENQQNQQGEEIKNI